MKAMPRNIPATRIPTMWPIFHSSPVTRRCFGSTTDHQASRLAKKNDQCWSRCTNGCSSAPWNANRKCHAYSTTTHSGTATSGLRSHRNSGRSPAGARERHEHRARQHEHQHRRAHAGEQQRRGDVGEQQVLGHVRAEQVVRQRVGRAEQRDRDQRDAGVPERLLAAPDLVAAPAQHGDGPRVHRDQQDDERDPGWVEGEHRPIVTDPGSAAAGASRAFAPTTR